MSKSEQSDVDISDKIKIEHGVQEIEPAAADGDENEKKAAERVTEGSPRSSQDSLTVKKQKTASKSGKKRAKKSV